MAETRTFSPSTNAVGAAIRAALGDDVRPVTPGSTPPPAPQPEPVQPPTVTTRTFTFGVRRQGPDETDDE